MSSNVCYSFSALIGQLEKHTCTLKCLVNLKNHTFESCPESFKENLLQLEAKISNIEQQLLNFEDFVDAELDAIENSKILMLQCSHQNEEVLEITSGQS